MWLVYQLHFLMSEKWKSYFKCVIFSIIYGFVILCPKRLTKDFLVHVQVLRLEFADKAGEAQM